MIIALTIAIWVLWVLGSYLMVDNIRAQPHPPYKRGQGLILLGIVVLWPFAVLLNLIIQGRPDNSGEEKKS